MVASLDVGLHLGEGRKVSDRNDFEAGRLLEACSKEVTVSVAPANAKVPLLEGRKKEQRSNHQLLQEDLR